MATIHDCSLERLMECVDHLRECDDCQREPVHQWDLRAWEVVFRRLTPGNPRWMSLDDRQRADRERVVGRLLDVIAWIVSRSVRDAARVSDENAALRSDLQQLRSGAPMRTREEVISAAEKALGIVNAPRVSGKTQYAANRVAQALQWALETPLQGTKTGFHPERSDGIA